MTSDTIEDMARTMLCESSLPTSIWVESVNIISYVLNRCLIHPILEKTLYELFKGWKPNILIFVHLVVNVSFTTTEKREYVSLMLEAM